MRCWGELCHVHVTSGGLLRIDCTAQSTLHFWFMIWCAHETPLHLRYIGPLGQVEERKDFLLYHVDMNRVLA